MSTRIEVIAASEDTTKGKGDLLEELAKELLETQSYYVDTQIRCTASELDLVCSHAVNGKTVYVECKAHRDPLSANALKNLLGSVTFHHYDEGWLISAGPLGKDAKGFKTEWERKPSQERQKLGIYTPDRIVEALENARVISPPPREHCNRLLSSSSSAGEWLLLISPFGRFWACTCVCSGVPAGVYVFDAKQGTPISDITLLRRLSKTDTSLASLDFTFGATLDEEATRPMETQSFPSVVEVKHGETWDDYRPARPEHFIGRKNAQDRILDFLCTASEKTSNTRVFAITGDTGMGKSSLIAKLRSRISNNRWKSRFFLYAVDVRAATGPNYISAALLSGLREGARRGYGRGYPDQLAVTDHTDPLSSPAIQDYLQTLEDKNEVLCLVLDQFEELYSKPDLFPVFEEAQRLFISAAASTSNLVVGFVLRSDSTVQQDHPAYHMWHQLADHRYETRLRVFSPREIAAALTLFERELGEKLRPELRRQIAENCEGYPWLLKKLCIHLYEQIQCGSEQGDLDETMDVESLFASDINACTQQERTCLQVIARQSPADWYEILETAGPDVIRSLQDKRLIVRSGDRLNLYWDVFREYVLTNKVPFIPFTYLCSSPSVGAFLSVASRLSFEKPLSAKEISDETGLSVKTVGNVVHDLIMFGVARGRRGAVILDGRMPSAAEQHVLERIRLVFKRHALMVRLNHLEEGALITVDDMISALREINSAATHRESTWQNYADRLGPWLVASGLLEATSGGWRLRDHGKPKMPSKRGSRFRIGCFLGDAPPMRVVEAFTWLHHCSAATQTEIKNAGYRNSVRVLDRLELTSRDESGNYVPVYEAPSADAATQIVWEAACQDETLCRVLEFLSGKPSANGFDIGHFLSESEGQEWSVASKQRIGNALRTWAIWIGEQNADSRAPKAPGPRVAQDTQSSENSSLFNQ